MAEISSKIDIPFMTQTAEKPYPFIGAAHTYIAQIRDNPHPRDLGSQLLMSMKYRGNAAMIKHS